MANLHKNQTTRVQEDFTVESVTCERSAVQATDDTVERRNKKAFTEDEVDEIGVIVEGLSRLSLRGCEVSLIAEQGHSERVEHQNLLQNSEINSTKEETDHKGSRPIPNTGTHQITKTNVKRKVHIKSENTNLGTANAIKKKKIQAETPNIRVPPVPKRTSGNSPRGNVGLPNTGNSCWLNAIIQALAAVLWITSVIQLVNVSTRFTPAIARLLHTVLFVKKRKNVDHYHMESVLCLFARELELKVGCQQDAGEVLRHILENEIGQNLTSAGQSNEIVLGSTCVACQFSQERHIHMLEVLPVENCDLRNHIDRFLNNYIRSSQICENCGDTLKKSQLNVTFPDLLIIRLNRAGEDNRKLLTSVKINNPLDIRGHRYALKAAIVHIGEWCHSGHFVTYKNFEGRSLIVCDDSNVYPCLYKDFYPRVEKNAVILMFSRVSA